MKKVVGILMVITALTLITSLGMTDTVELRLSEIRNDREVDGELHLGLDIRISQGTSPRTLDGATIDIYYGTELTAWADDPATNWAFEMSPDTGYNKREVSKHTGRYYLWITGDVLEFLPGWEVTDGWQRIVTLRWTINTATSVSVEIRESSADVSYYESESRIDWDVSIPSPNPKDVTLPVELSNFTATYGYDGCALEWTTQTEINNVGFFIYRSTTEDGEYVQVNKNIILGAGNSGMPNTYKYIDDGIDSDVGTYFYYLEDVDVTGVRSKSQIIKVTINILKVDQPIPQKSALLQNYPNPYNPETWIPYMLQVDTDVTIKIYDVTGRMVKTLSLGERKAGMYVSKDRAVYWDGKNEYGERVSSGIYFYAIEAGEFRAIKRMLMLK